jgi:hypothetical protein
LFQLQAINSNNNNEGKDAAGKLVGVAMASLLSLSLLSAPLPAQADGQTEKFKLPPIDFSDQNRCRLNSSTIGQANAARDKLYDLRQCKLSGAQAVGFDLSGVIMTKVNAQFSKSVFPRRLYLLHFIIYSSVFS